MRAYPVLVQRAVLVAGIASAEDNGIEDFVAVAVNAAAVDVVEATPHTPVSTMTERRVSGLTGCWKRKLGGYCGGYIG